MKGKSDWIYSITIRYRDTKTKQFTSVLVLTLYYSLNEVRWKQETKEFSETVDIAFLEVHFKRGNQWPDQSFDRSY